MQCKHENQQCLPESTLNFREKIVSSRKAESFLRKFLQDLFVISCWVVFLIILVLLRQFTGRKLKWFSIGYPQFLYSTRNFVLTLKYTCFSPFFHFSEHSCVTQIHIVPEFLSYESFSLSSWVAQQLDVRRLVTTLSHFANKSSAEFHLCRASRGWFPNDKVPAVSMENALWQ